MLFFLAGLTGATGEAQTAATGEEVDYGRLLRELKPRMVIEFQQDHLNAYLRAHPEEFAIPEGFESPYVGFYTNIIEVSARTKVLFIPTRVRVGMTPEVHQGRLRLKVANIKAGKIPLPASFHSGTADTIARIVNGVLERNEVELQAVAVRRGVIAITAAVGQTTCPPATTGDQ